jgi:hypothetical protein
MRTPIRLSSIPLSPIPHANHNNNNNNMNTMIGIPMDICGETPEKQIVVKLEPIIDTDGDKENAIIPLIQSINTDKHGNATKPVVPTLLPSSTISTTAPASSSSSSIVWSSLRLNLEKQMQAINV